MEKKLHNMGLASILCIVFTAAWLTGSQKANTADFPCSCWDSGTSGYMGAKCYAGIRSIQSGIDSCNDEIWLSSCDIGWDFANILSLGLATGISAMEVCHTFCVEAAKKTNFDGNPWWYADDTAFSSCSNKDNWWKGQKPLGL